MRKKGKGKSGCLLEEVNLIIVEVLILLSKLFGGARKKLLINDHIVTNEKKSF